MGVGPTGGTPDDRGAGEEPSSTAERLVETTYVLLREPGRLTADACAGRGARWPRPLVIYLVCAIAFFASVRLAAAVDPAAPSIHVRTAADSAVMMLADSEAFVNAPEVVGNSVVRVIGPGMAWTLFTHQTVLQDILANAIPWAAFLLLPFFAVLTLVVWRDGRLAYSQHLVFAMHVHAACFLALLLPVLLRPLDSGVVAFAASAAALVYTTWYTVVAARVALGGTTREVNLRLMIAGLLYLPVALATTLAVALVSIRSL